MCRSPEAIGRAAQKDPRGTPGKDSHDRLLDLILEITPNWADPGLAQNVPLPDVEYEIKVQKIDSFMRLDRSAQRGLNVFPERTGEPKQYSLYGLLNHCKTPMGQKELKVSLSGKVQSEHLLLLRNGSDSHW